MEMTFMGILHGKNTVDTTTGVQAKVEIIAPLFETDTAKLYQFHSAPKLVVTARMKDKELGAITGVMKGTRTKVTKEGTFIHVNMVGDKDHGFEKLDKVVGEKMEFHVLMEEDANQPELAGPEE